MTIIYRLLAILLVTFKRLRAQLGLTLATLAGLSVGVALIMAVPFYADAVNFRILQEELGRQTDRNNRPPFAYLYNYIGAWHDPVEWDAVESAEAYARTEGASILGLEQQEFVAHYETNKFRIYREAGRGTQLASLSFATSSDLRDHINIVEGEWPTATPQSLDGDSAVLDVIITRGLANEAGFQLGQQLEALDPQSPRDARKVIRFRISGIWEPINPDDEWWFYAAESFDERLSIPRDSYAAPLANALDGEVHLAAWYFVLDGSQVGTEQVDQLVSGANRFEAGLAERLPNSQVLQSPIDPLGVYQRSVARLARQLIGFNAPTIGLVIAFIGLVVGLSVGQRRNELAVMRSRGASVGQLLSMALLEALLLGGAAFAFGTLLALWLTGLMGSVRSFLDFSADTVLRITPNQLGLQAGGVALLTIVIAQLLPTALAAGHTIVSYKQEQARALRPPWWQRYYLDVLLFAWAARGIYQLQTEGTLLLGTPGERSLLDNPILLLLPTLAIVSLTLFFLRLLPWLMRSLTWVLQQTNSLALLQAARYLARSTGHYMIPLVLLTLTVSLSVFTASLARTFDLQLFDQQFYRVGADITLLTSPTTSAQNRFFAQAADETNEQFLAPEFFTSLTGVEAATRVGRYPANIRLESGAVTGEFVGIDRHTFGKVAYWRWDFASYKLGSLLNQMVYSTESILVPADFLEEHNLAVGDVIPINVSIGGDRVSLNATIVGDFDLFPSWYPIEHQTVNDPGFIFVGQLNTIFEQAGGQFAHHIWVDTGDGFDLDAFVDVVNNQPGLSIIYTEPRSAIETALVQPERQGVFGLLSIGFIASALLTVVGFFLYALFSFRQRMIELGILRAVGLKVTSMIRLLAYELGLLIGSGLVLGTVFGIWTSQQFIPLLQSGTRQSDLVPPYLVEIAWPAVFQIYLLFALLFLVALGALAWLLSRMQIFQAIKLGETV